MNRTMMSGIAFGLLALQSLQTHAGAMYARAGWSAQLSTNHHLVSGTVTIVDAVTLQVNDFTYDGQAPAVYFYLGTDETDGSFASGLQVSPLLSGTAFDGTEGPFLLNLPQGNTMDPYHAVSVWCAAFDVNFGSGTFTAVPEPGTISLVAFGGLVVLMRRRSMPDAFEASSSAP
jgi:hypothetical protein